MAAKKQYTLEEIRLVSAIADLVKKLRGDPTITPYNVAVAAACMQLRALVLVGDTAIQIEDEDGKTHQIG